MNPMQRLQRLEEAARREEESALLDRAAARWGLDRADLEAETLAAQRLIDHLGHEGAMQYTADEFGLSVAELQRQMDNDLAELDAA